MTNEITTREQKADARAIRDLARQDQAGDTDDSYARTGDAVDTIRRWRDAGREAGDRDLVEMIERVGVREAARIYEAARERGPYAVLDIRGEQRYGRILSRHDTERAALARCGELEDEMRRTSHDAITHLMWTVAEVRGSVGERVRWRE